jgi:hypothetical protein
MQQHSAAAVAGQHPSLGTNPHPTEGVTALCLGSLPSGTGSVGVRQVPVPREAGRVKGAKQKVPNQQKQKLRAAGMVVFHLMLQCWRWVSSSQFCVVCCHLGTHQLQIVPPVNQGSRPLSGAGTARQLIELALLSE